MPCGAGDGLPLHVKAVPPLDVEKVRQLARAAGAELAGAWEEAMRWVLTEAPYAELQRKAPRGALEVPTTRLSPEDVAKMEAAGQVRRVPLQQVDGYVKVFGVPEMAKLRRRAIKHTADINDRFGRDTLQAVVFPTRSQQSRQSASGAFVAAVDFAAYFDQFALVEEVQRRMCFRSGAVLYALTRMPMGQRHAVAAAQRTTDVLTSFALPPGVSVQSCIDNIRFVGPKKGVRLALLELVARCRLCGVTINELPSANSGEDDRRQAETLIRQDGDWLGAHYDHAQARQRLAAKTVEKLRRSWERREEWTLRAYAAHMGLLFFATSVLRLKLAGYFDALKGLRGKSQKVTACPELWDLPVPAMAEGESRALQAWTRVATANAFVPCETEAPAGLTLLTDACETGWGALCVDSDTGMAMSHSAMWTPQERITLQTVHSTYAEPEAVYRAVCRFVRPAETRQVLVLTDSAAAKGALAKGHSPSFVVNAIAARLNSAFGEVQFRYAHVPGKQNGADGLSRATETTLATDEVRRRISAAAAAAAAGKPQ